MSNLSLIKIANIVFETEKKVLTQESFSPLIRNVNRMKTVIEEGGLLVINPSGEAFSETRTDIEATLINPTSENQKICDVIKPIIYEIQEGKPVLIQKGIVIVE